MHKKLATYRGIALVLLFTSVLAAPAVAQHDEAPLTTRQVGAFLDSLPDLHSWAERAEQKYSDIEYDGDAEDFSAAYSAMIAGLQTHEMLEDITRIVKRHGFDSVESWSMVGNRMISAYVALKYEQTSPERNAALKEALERIDESEIDEEQKEAMRQMLMATQNAFAGFDASDADKRAVAPFMERIEGWGKEDSTN